MTQKERISKYLDDFGSITPLEAMRDLGIMRLGARIWEMIRDGEKIIRDGKQQKPLRTGHAVRTVSQGRVKKNYLGGQTQ